MSAVDVEMAPVAQPKILVTQAQADGTTVAAQAPEAPSKAAQRRRKAASPRKRSTESKKSESGQTSSSDSASSAPASPERQVKQQQAVVNGKSVNDVIVLPGLNLDQNVVLHLTYEQLQLLQRDHSSKTASKNKTRAPRASVKSLDRKPAKSSEKEHKRKLNIGPATKVLSAEYQRRLAEEGDAFIDPLQKEADEATELVMRKWEDSGRQGDKPKAYSAWNMFQKHGKELGLFKLLETPKDDKEESKEESAEKTQAWYSSLSNNKHSIK